MKKTLLTSLALLAMTTAAFAGSGKNKTFGTVDTITVASNSFTVKGDDGQTYLFNVNEATEMEKKGGWYDEDISITDMKTGDRVQVEYFSNNPDFLIVDEVEIFPAKK